MGRNHGQARLRRRANGARSSEVEGRHFALQSQEIDRRRRRVSRAARVARLAGWRAVQTAENLHVNMGLLEHSFIDENECCIVNNHVDNDFPVAYTYVDTCSIGCLCLHTIYYV